MYFFVDPAQLLTQTDAQAYGPVQNQEDTHYRVTSKFQVQSDTPAIAALGGVVLVQPHATDPALCNVAIKVDDPADARTQFDKIDYLIYRGLRRDSFLTAATTPTLLPKDPTNSDLVARLWQAQEQVQQDAVKLGLALTALPPTPDNLGFNRLNPGQTLEAAFADTSYFYPLFKLEAGCSLGTFASGIEAGFEVVVFDRFYQPTVGDLRLAEMVFEVPATPGSTAGHDADYTTQRTRENILNYIDPAAYYTMHYQGGVSYKDASGSHPCSTVELIGSKLLEAFLPAKNRIYLDIRNELGGSLNFYRDNEGPAGFEDQHFKYGFDAQTLALSNYYTSKWPLFSLVVDPSLTTGTQLLVQVRQGHNPRPLLFVEYGYPVPVGSTQPLLGNQCFFEATATGAAEWSATLRLPLLPPNTARTHPLWFIKLRCIRQEVPASLATDVPGAPLRTYALDNVFGPFRADMLANSQLGNSVLPGKQYLANVDGQGGSIVQIRKIQNNKLITWKAERLFTFPMREQGSLFAPGALFPPVFFDDRAETRWLVQPGVITRQITVQHNGRPLPLLREDFSLASNALPDLPSPSLTLLTQQIRDYILPALSPFNPALDNVRAVFGSVTREQDDVSVAGAVDANSLVPVNASIKYISTQLQLGGLGQNAQFTTNLLLSAVPCYTLDSNTFVSEAEVLNLAVLKSNPDSFISVDDFVKYVKVVEEVYAADDTNAIQTATRLRQHYYGPWASGTIVVENGKGLVFNKAIARARYLTASGAVLLGASMLQSAASRAAYTHLLSHADENLIGDNPSPYLVIKNSYSKKYE